MRILLLGDASNYHRALSRGLAGLGHDVTLASDGGGWLRTGRDIDISRPARGKIGGALLWVRLRSLLASDLKGFDIVQFASPGFASLRPSRLRDILLRLKKANGPLFLTALGADSLYVRALTGGNPPLRYSEFNLGTGLTPWARIPDARVESWLAPELTDYTEFFYDNLSGVVSALYEYQKVVETVRPEMPSAYGGIPIALDELPAPQQRPEGAPLKIYLCAQKGREIHKGADILFREVRALAARHPGEFELLMPPNMPYDHFLRFLGGVDVLVDQLYSYTPATSALLGMALGAVPVSGAEPEFARFIGEPVPLPIINPDPFDPSAFTGEILRLARDRSLLADYRLRARRFVETHNSAPTVARRFEQLWKKAIE